VPFDMHALTGKLEALPPKKQVAFAAAVAQRLVQNYEAFSRQCQWGSTEPLLQGLAELWAFVRGNRCSPRRVEDLRSRIAAVTPHPGDFDSVYGSAALDAANAVRESLQCAIHPDPKRVAEVASFARDTVDMFIQVRDQMEFGQPNYEALILAHPLMVRELDRQQSALRWLDVNEIASDQQLRSFQSAAGADESALPLSTGEQAKSKE
jgi:uncharacterized protein YjaG (DUF416 family)